MVIIGAREVRLPACWNVVQVPEEREQAVKIAVMFRQDLLVVLRVELESPRVVMRVVVAAMLVPAVAAFRSAGTSAEITPKHGTGRICHETRR